MSSSSNSELDSALSAPREADDKGAGHSSRDGSNNNNNSGNKGDYRRGEGRDDRRRRSRSRSGDNRRRDDREHRYRDERRDGASHNSSRGGGGGRSRSRSRDGNSSRQRNDRDDHRQQQRPFDRSRDQRDRRPDHNDRGRNDHRGGQSSRQRGASSVSTSAAFHAPEDTQLKPVSDDPRVDGSGVKHVRTSGKGINTESFDPASTIVRPDLRVVVGRNAETYGKPLKHDDIVIVPNFFCDEDDWTLYYKLIEEMRESQSKGTQGAEWISWAEGAHLISQNPKDSATYQMVQDKIAKYFEIPPVSVGTRFNWYRDSSDWKPFHHDSAAFNPKRAANQNITVGASFGCTRELALLHAKNGTKVYFPQTNGMLFSFGRDVNIVWKHGINALSAEEQEAVGGKGRVSIILWGKAPNCIEEDNSPPMFPYEDRSVGRNGQGNRGGHGGRGGGGGDGICRDFQKGNCSRGDSCRFKHATGK